MATLSVVAIAQIVAAAASTAAVAYGAYQQGQASSNAAKYQAQVSQRNAGIARQNAALQAKQQDRLNRLRLGTIRANAGAAGGVANEGSALDIIADSAIQGELKRQDIIRAGEIKASGFEAGASLSTFEAGQAATSGRIGAGAALLQGASSTAGQLSRI